jgi:DUF1365 family protein
MFWLALDLDELATLDREIRWFGHNRRAPVAILDKDYGGPGEGRIRDRIAARLREAGVDSGDESIMLLTVPRVFGYVFNPVSFYLCRDGDDSLAALVAEVRNPFGELHHYVARPQADRDDPGLVRFTLPKSFYVSPFLDVDGAYELRMRLEGDRFDLQVELGTPRAIVFSAGMCGTGAALTSGSLRATLCRFPLFAGAIMLRIKWQAFRLYVGKRLPMYDKPGPDHPATTAPSRPSVWHRLRHELVRRSRRATSSSASLVTSKRNLP